MSLQAGHLLVRALVFILLFLILAFGAGVPIYALEPIVISKIDTEQRIVALTFDDGPHEKNTPQLLDLLRDEEIRATFFVVGENARANAQLMERIVKDGHEIGNHTFRHTYMGGKDRAVIEREIDLCDDEIFKHSEYSATLLRPPGGIFDRTVLDACRERGYSLILWSIDTRDWSGACAASIEKNIMDNIECGSIILCHDYTAFESHTVEALRVVIPKLKELGYRFVTVSELIELS